MSRPIQFELPGKDEAQGSDPTLSTTQRDQRPPRPGWPGAHGMRLAFLCLMLVMVLWAMNHAAKPESWNWLFKFGAVELPDTPPLDVASQSGLPTGRPQSTVDPQAAAAATPARKATGEEAVEVLEQEFWRQLLQQMDGAQQLRLFNLVESVVQQIRLPAGSTAATQPILELVQQSRGQFTDQLEPSAERQALAEHWSTSLEPAFQAVLQDAPQAKWIDNEVLALGTRLQNASESLIRDKTPVERAREAYAWFAAWSEVFDQPLQQPVEQRATVTQLLSQPEAWRGKTLQIEGQALRVERVPASHNALGIQRYYVIWIKPDHPSLYPYCVYTLMAPESLMGDPGEALREVNQRVTATARFFKNRLFQSRHSQGEEAAFAPVLLTAAVAIPPPGSPAGQSQFQWPGGSTIGLVLILIGGLAVSLALAVYRSTQSGKSRALPQTAELTPSFSRLQSDNRVQTTLEKLQRMSQSSATHPDSTSPTDPTH